MTEYYGWNTMVVAADKYAAPAAGHNADAEAREVPRCRQDGGRSLPY